jgi:hypothetical protein
MTLKTLLLGSAATFAVVGGAQAADLSVAEPVEYVKVCDYFGTGYWYIPGTDTCIRVSGYARFDTSFYPNRDEGVGGHSAGWNFKTEGDIEVLAKSMTEYGVLTGDVQYDFNSAWGGPTAGRGNPAGLDHITIGLGALQAGFEESLFDYGGDLGTGIYGGPHSTQNVDDIRLSWAAAGFGLAVGLEDPRDRWASGLPTSYSTPDIVGKITTSQANWDGAISGAYTGAYGGGWAIQAGATFKLDAITKGDAFRIQAAYADNALAFLNEGYNSGFPYGGTGGLGDPAKPGSAWSALASFQHFWTPTLSTSLLGGYASNWTETPGGDSAWTAEADLIWQPVTGFLAGPAVIYTSSHDSASSSWVVDFRMQRSW